MIVLPPESEIEQVHQYITCEYCGLGQKMRDVLLCLGCGAPMGFTLPNLIFKASADTVREMPSLWSDWNDPS